MPRRIPRSPVPFETRLQEEAKDLRRRADELPPGRARDALLQTARQREAAAALSNWLQGPSDQRRPA